MAVDNNVTNATNVTTVPTVAQTITRKRAFEYKRVYVYVMRQKNGDFVKVGQSIHPEKRKKELEWNGPKELELLHTKLFYSREKAKAYESKILENLIDEDQGVARNGRFCEWFLCSNAVKKILKENYAMPILTRGRIRAKIKVTI